MMPNDLEILLQEIRNCTHCTQHLPLGPNPVVEAHQNSKIIIIGQAPGTKVHASGIPWDDASGKRLREWMGINPETFYDSSKIAIVPMGFCYPGKGKGGDLPPRKECAPLWHQQLLEQLPKLQLVLLIGQYAQKYYLKDTRKKNLTETVRSFKEYLPKYFPLVHPSPRNQIWMKKNDWFDIEVIPELQQIVKQALLV
jgi:uracil-DNA glycosylase family 4